MAQIPRWMLQRLPMWDYVCHVCGSRSYIPKIQCESCGSLLISLEKQRVPPEYLSLSRAMPMEKLKMAGRRLSDYVHSQVFPTLTRKQLAVWSRYFTIYHSDSWEDNTFNAWTSNPVVGGGVNSITAALARCGSLSFQSRTFLTGDGAYCQEDLDTPAQDYFARSYQRINTDIANDTWMGTMQLTRQASENDQLGVIYFDIAGVQVWRMTTRHNTVYEQFDSVITWVPNIWDCVELEMKAATGGYGTLDGEARMWINGVLGASTVNRNFGNANIDRYRVGSFWNNTNVQVDIFTDCAVAGDARILCAVDAGGGQHLAVPAIVAFLIQ